MRIGIITVFAVPNYGAMLQAYALSAFLRRQGHDAEVIDYRQPALAEMYRFRFGFPPAVNHWLRLRRCTRFVRGNIPLSRNRYHAVEKFRPDVAAYDAVITGSDQVWFTGPVQDYDPMFFLDWPDGTARRISYAPSVGETESFGKYTDQVRLALSRYHRIGVRDSHTAGLVAPLTNLPLAETVDPTFLHDFAELLPRDPPIKEPYLLVFGNFGGDLSGVVQEARRASGLKTVVSLQYACPGATLRVASPGPVEWLQWFKHASLVVTSYFHGTAFAVNFRRPFLTLPTLGRRQKVRTLLEPLGLADRCLEPDYGAPALAAALAASPPQWTAPAAALEQRVSTSKGFLHEALS